MGPLRNDLNPWQLLTFQINIYICFIFLFVLYFISALLHYNLRNLKNQYFLKDDYLFQIS